MTFHATQLGRFGELALAHFSGHVDPDLRAAHALALDGVAAPARPTLQAVLGSKMLGDDNDPQWAKWGASFSALLSSYQAQGGASLGGHCTIQWGGLPLGFCLHELTAPSRYWSLKSFASRLRGRTVVERADGTVGVDSAARPLWNYVVTTRGEILVAAEDFGWIKHTSIAGGHNVWVAGQLGIVDGTIRVADVQSGHYVLSGAANLMPGSHLAKHLIDFTYRVFRGYAADLDVPNIHQEFAVIWA